ncbi:hypothetical protein [Acinetobacter sp. M5A5_2a]
MSTTPLSYVAQSQLSTARQHLSLRRSLRRILIYPIQKHIVYIKPA